MSEWEGDEARRKYDPLGYWHNRAIVLERHIAALKAKAVENEKVFLTATANWADERIKLEAENIKLRQSQADESGVMDRLARYRERFEKAEADLRAREVMK